MTEEGKNRGKKGQYSADSGADAGSGWDTPSREQLSADQDLYDVGAEDKEIAAAGTNKSYDDVAAQEEEDNGPESFVLTRVWRAQPIELFFYFASIISCIVSSHNFPITIIRGELFTIGDTEVILNLPLWCLIPFVILGHLIWWTYDARFTIDEQGIESRIGILSFSQSITRINYSDIRSVESKQTLLERILDTGTVLIGTAASEGVEITIEGIASPGILVRAVNEEKEKHSVKRTDSSTAGRKGQDGYEGYGDDSSEEFARSA